MISVVIRIIGRSVASGAIATLIPSFLLFFKVSEIINVSKGPGVRPEDKPKKIP
jgi:hypothetical protein